MGEEREPHALNTWPVGPQHALKKKGVVARGKRLRKGGKGFGDTCGTRCQRRLTVGGIIWGLGSSICGHVLGACVELMVQQVGGGAVGEWEKIFPVPRALPSSPLPRFDHSPPDPLIKISPSIIVSPVLTFCVGNGELVKKKCIRYTSLRFSDS